ncbi:efflux RND transporter periplasmic adaptor subunit [Pseudokordiimonas caeni]|uniref:efflux RND transporter periplasmic adaptor subunit n=1 Tax=Pseudokordiimonas caeni TaxID=2997908 RepID=UPI0028114E9C|nr:efflux RND transporter periplasmic adaptor subunit [Pseudokordiimonas caeni]
MRKILKVAAPIAVLLAGVAAFQVLDATKPQPEKNEDKPRPTSLYVDEVRSETVTVGVKTQGEVSAKTQIDLIPQVSGRIVKVADAFAAGGTFGPGDVLVQIDPADYELAVTRARARIAEARVKLDQELADAEIKEKQWKDWVKDGEPTPLALNKPQVAEAEAKLRAAEADLAEAQLALSRTRITVPFSGRVIARNIGVGQVVNAGTSIGRVFATDVVEIKLPLTDSQIAELGLPIGFNASANNPAPVVTLSATLGGRQHIWEGSLVRTLADVDKDTRLIYAVAEVQDPYGKSADMGMPLAVGLFVNAEIAGTHSRSALVMPRVALRGEDKVYVINKDDKLEIRPVEIVSTSVDTLLVSEGVAPGERVVVSPVHSAFDGMHVVPIIRTVENESAAESTTVASR